MADNIVKYGLIAASVYVLGKALTKDKLLSEKNVRNTALGGLAGYAGGPKLEEMLKNDKKKAFYIVAGAVTGGIVEKLVENGSIKKALDYSKDKAGIGKKTEAAK